MIPKKIHYCWFGGAELPKSARKCIQSWKKHCPDYEIVRWDESNFDVSCNAYVKEAYEAKKYAFVSDYARFYILYHNGGIYFDTDVELIKPIAPIISKGSFMGCETDGGDGEKIAVAPGLGLAAYPQTELYKDIMNFYDGIHFLMADGSLNQVTVVDHVTNILFSHGLQNINGIQTVENITIYPKEYFCPMDNNTGKLELTENTVSIHWYSKSWIGKKDRIISNISRPFHRIFGNDCFRWLKKK